MERVLSFEKVDQYLASLAQKHVDINDYCSTSLLELQEKITSAAGISSPILVFFDYKWKLDGTPQRTFNTRTISFAVQFDKVPADDFVAQRNAINNAEKIGLELFSRIHIDSFNESIGWLYKNFIKESAHAVPSEPEGPDGYWGMDFHFDLKVPEPLTPDSEKWSDGNQFCAL